MFNSLLLYFNQPYSNLFHWIRFHAFRCDSAPIGSVALHSSLLGSNRFDSVLIGSISPWSALFSLNRLYSTLYGSMSLLNSSISFQLHSTPFYSIRLYSSLFYCLVLYPSLVYSNRFDWIGLEWMGFNAIQRDSTRSSMIPRDSAPFILISITLGLWGSILL